MNILLLGYGFLGRYLYRQLSETHHVKVISNNIPDNQERGFYLRDFSQLAEDDPVFDHIDLVIHTIHTTVPATSMLNLERDISDNVFSSIHLLSIMEKKRITKLIFISSGGAVYGNPKNELIDEDHPTDPLSGYGISKLAIEKYIKLFHKTSGIEYLILRPSNLFGPNQNLYKPQGIVGHLLNALQNDEEIDIWGSGEGKKDYLYVGDLVKAIQISVDKFGVAKNGVFNVASGFHYSINDIIELIEGLSQKTIKKKYSTSKSFDVQNVLLSGDLFNKSLTFRAQTRLEHFIKNYFGQ